MADWKPLAPACMKCERVTGKDTCFPGPCVYFHEQNKPSTKANQIAQIDRIRRGSVPHPHRITPMSEMMKLAEIVEGLTDLETPEAAVTNNALHDLLPEPKCVQPPNYLRSLDAAMQLVPEGWEYTLMNANGYDEATLTNHAIKRTAWASSTSLPLALCAAALKARAHLEGEEK